MSDDLVTNYRKLLTDYYLLFPSVFQQQVNAITNNA